jgi:hypothetical protein
MYKVWYMIKKTLVGMSTAWKPNIKRNSTKVLNRLESKIRVKGIGGRSGARKRKGEGISTERKRRTSSALNYENGSANRLSRGSVRTGDKGLPF